MTDLDVPLAAAEQSMRLWTVVGLDLSLTSTGVAIAHAGGAVTCSVKSKGGKDDSLLQRRERLSALARKIMATVNNAQPDLVVIEAPAFSRVGGHNHDRSGLWWLVVFSLLARYPVVEVPPTSRTKYGAGRGNAAKDEVLTAVVRRYSHVPVRDNNEADALILAAMGARHLGQPIEAKLPEVNQAGMSAIKWVALR